MSDSVEELQAKLELLKEQEFALAAKESELKAQEQAELQAAKGAVEQAEKERADREADVKAVFPVYREHGRYGNEGGV